jgi:hypothetical protein
MADISSPIIIDGILRKNNGEFHSVYSYVAQDMGHNYGLAFAVFQTEEHDDLIPQRRSEWCKEVELLMRNRMLTDKGREFLDSAWHFSKVGYEEDEEGGHKYISTLYTNSSGDAVLTSLPPYDGNGDVLTPIEWEDKKVPRDEVFQDIEVYHEKYARLAEPEAFVDESETVETAEPNDIDERPWWKFW